MTEEVQETPTVLEVEIKKNPLVEKLKKKIPGEKFRLPSKGMFYTNGELDPEVEDGEIILYPMTTVDELAMRSPDMLYQGTAVTDVISRCVPQVLKPGKLVASDVDYILTCLRKVSYGPGLPITFKCQHCEAEKQEEIISIDYFLRHSKELTRDQFDAMTVTIDEYKIRLKPCVFDEMLNILRRDTDFSSVEKLSEWIDDSLTAVIRSVDGINDKELIKEWLSKLPRSIKDELSTKIETINQWGVEFAFDVECKSCKKMNHIKSSLNPTSFFTSPSSPMTE